MDDSGFREKRTCPRFPVSIPVTASDTSRKEKIFAHTCDISTKGLCLLVDTEVPEGIHLNLSLQMLDDKNDICKQGKVVWSSKLESGKYRIGISLEDQKLEAIPIVLRTIMSRRTNY
ncbi:MAG: PilZ domain-containing protein [Candidatus Omnitrophica bacterium]|nr:PilZ domain-containing protein [Candidatus Omnitrophota bacterium]